MSECTPGDDGYCTGGCVTRPHTWSASGARCIECGLVGTGDPCNDGDCKCECSEDYGPCEDHCTVLVQREGASTRTADELAVLYCDDAAGLLEDIGGTVLATDLEIVRDAWALLETERRHGVAWFPEDDAEALTDSLTTLQYQLESELSSLDAPHWTFWNDGYVIYRVTGGPLLDA